ncbi:pilus assembly FimT family protein [Alteromonas oceanisediminis]|uniref:pilus assembly FimT family protein n=1 Tax=Alteromonas oceanisediminis TaxID=2836180 RepID=UPI001BDAD39F|nr:type II secretion system protein [Alteromonas oceanisediminis]MBT0586876.1 type II secretion system GspH family protein [Alteromonas oceanisediminis]
MNTTQRVFYQRPPKSALRSEGIVPSRHVKRFFLAPHATPQRGYSLVELIAVILLIGVLSVGAVARFSGSDGFAEYTYQNRLVSALRNIQQRAMNDSRNGFCYRINLVSGTAAPAFGPPTHDYTAANAAASCSGAIDSSVDFLATTATEMAAENIAMTSQDGASTALSFIGFNSLGQPQSNIANCASGCRVDFVGSSTASVCIASQGYIHAC